MCIAILNDNTTTLKKNVLKNCWKNNGDGAGMLWTENGVLKSHKEMIDFDSFYNKYLSIRQSKQSKKSYVVLHFRISTHGAVDETNCHPFFVNDKLGFVHNGIISKAPVSKLYSDTYMFNDSILRNFKHDFLNCMATMGLIDEYIGYSKLVFLDNENNYTIVGENLGHWNGKCWFSNDTYKEVSYKDYGGKKVPSTTGIGYRHWGTYDWKTRSWSNNENKYDDFRDWENFDTTDSLEKDSQDDFKNFNDDYEYDEVCECCQNQKEVLKYDKNYEVYMCEDCTKDFCNDYSVLDWDSTDDLQDNTDHLYPF